ncbi:hypothetical protein Tco_1493946 [Tanacetum coccineum]
MKVTIMATWPAYNIRFPLKGFENQAKPGLIEIHSRLTSMDDEMLPRLTDTSSAKARTAKDIQEISWERFPLSVDIVDKEREKRLRKMEKKAAGGGFQRELAFKIINSGNVQAGAAGADKRANAAAVADAKNALITMLKHIREQVQSRKSETLKGWINGD